MHEIVNKMGLCAMTKLTKTAAFTSIPAALLLLSGCRVGPAYNVPAATPQAPPAAYKEAPAPGQDTGDWKPAQPQDAMLRGKWWEIYNDPELNALEEQVNVNNQNIKQYFENFMEARTLIAQAHSQLYPTVAVGPSYSRAQASSNTGNSAATNIRGQGSQLTSLPLSVSWEPDLWGKVRNQIREYQYNAQLSAADLENERLTEQATLAQVFFELRGQDALIKLYQDTVAADQKSLELTKSSYDVGISDQISVVEADTTLQTAKSSLINLGVARAQYEHAIALLIGVPASGFSMPVKPLEAAAPGVPLGLPSQLLERRPDIAAAERNMAAANAQIGIAVAAYYPSLDIGVEGGFESSAFKHLFDWPSRFWSIGPTVSETIFDAGLRRATVNQYIATYNANVAAYRQTVLTAFQQTEDYLAAVRILSQQIKQQQAAVDSSQKYLDLATYRYKTGLDPYLNVMTAQLTLLNNQQSLTSLKTQQMTSTVQLIEALGGGWDRSQLPSTQDVSAHMGKLSKQP
jgi:NodT family efflux transporter outer membrane factor (OMF) lipoprotein